MRSSRWIPQDASDVGAYATTFASILTLLLFFIAWRQLRLLRQQIHVASREMEAAQASAEAAQVSASAALEAAADAARSRVDAHSPRFAVEVDLSPGALADPFRTAMPGGGDLGLLDTTSVHRSRVVNDGDEFVFDRDRHQFIWFRATGTVRNEGTSSGRVRLDGEAHFEGAEQGEEIVLRPGQARSFEWAAGFSAATLADRRNEPQPAREFLVITGTSYEERGVIDKVHLELASRCLHEVQGHQGAFQFRDQLPGGSAFPSTNVAIFPVQRIYRWDWDANRIPPAPWAAD